MMNRRSIVITTLLFSVACAPEATLPEDAFAPIRIGIVTSLSGGLGTDGPGWRDAARLAAFELNAAGGPLPGRPIELVVANDETNPLLAANIARRLIEDEGVVGIVGAGASSITLELAGVSVPARIPQISCCSTSDLITEANEALAPEERFLFRTAPPDVLQARVVAIAAEELLCTRLAVLHLDDDYGVPFGTAIESAFIQSGGEVTIRVPFPDEQSSYTSQLTMVRDSTPDCIAVVAFPVSAGVIMRDWSALTGTPDVTWIGTDGVRAPGFVQEVGDPSLIEGFYGTSPVTDPLTPEYNRFQNHYRSVFGSDPIPFSANQYDAVALMGLAIARAGTTDGSAVRDAILQVSSPPADRGTVRAGELAEALDEIGLGREVDYQGASGNTNIDALHNVRTPYEIWRYDGPSTTPCASATVLSGSRGSFCRFRTIAAEEIE